MKKLEVSTPNPEEIHMTRTFDAPRALVIEAMTTPELLKRWLGNTRADVVSVTVDFRVGGTYRFAFRNKRDGSEFAFGGVFTEIAADRIVQREHFEGQPGESTVTTTYVERAGTTTMTVAIRFESQMVRDIVLRTGMADGAGESYDGLDALLTERGKRR